MSAAFVPSYFLATSLSLSSSPSLVHHQYAHCCNCACARVFKYPIETTARPELTWAHQNWAFHWFFLFENISLAAYGSHRCLAAHGHFTFNIHVFLHASQIIRKGETQNGTKPIRAGFAAHSLGTFYEPIGRRIKIPLDYTWCVWCVCALMLPV